MEEFGLFDIYGREEEPVVGIVHEIELMPERACIGVVGPGGEVIVGVFDDEQLCLSLGGLEESGFAEGLTELKFVGRASFGGVSLGGGVDSGYV